MTKGLDTVDRWRRSTRCRCWRISTRTPIPPRKWAGGHAVKLGRNQYEATFLGYSVRIIESELGKTTELMGLFTVDAHFEMIGEDSIYGEGTGSYYLATQDADRDGFPDDGEEPIVCVPWGWMSKRLTRMPGCVLTP